MARIADKLEPGVKILAKSTQTKSYKNLATIHAKYINSDVFRVWRAVGLRAPVFLIVFLLVPQFETFHDTVPLRLLVTSTTQFAYLWTKEWILSSFGTISSRPVCWYLPPTTVSFHRRTYFLRLLYHYKFSWKNDKYEKTNWTFTPSFNF